MKTLLSFLFVFTLLIPTAMARENIKQYEVPDIKTTFCGPVINFQYCKCAFHGKYCKNINLGRGASRTYVLEQFRAWNKERIQKMAMACKKEGGYWNINNWSCLTCTDGNVLKGNRCVEQEKTDSEKKECEKALKNIKTDWVKYSDFDGRLGTDVSYEVQQFNKTLNELAVLATKADQIKYQMEIDRQVRLSLKEYKKALVQNIKVNLLKAFWRLSYVTYSTIKSAQGTAGSLEKMLSPDSVAEGVGAGLKVIQAHIPPNAKKYQIDTNTTTGKIKSIAWNATLETIESVGNPGDIAKQFMKDTRGAVLPNPNISDEEISILRNQHLSNKAVDIAIAESYEINSKRRAEVLKLEKQITEKYNELQEWKHKEYKRVRGNLEKQCNGKK